MKKKIIAVVCAVLLAAILLFAAQALVMPKYIENPEGRLVGEYYKEAGDNDVIFLGDCEVYESFVPAILWEKYGISSYVRGTAQQLIWQSYYLLEEMMRIETPKAVVFNVYAMKYGEPQKEAYNRMTLDGMRWSQSKISAIKASMIIDDYENGESSGKIVTESFIEYVFPILRFHSRISQLTADDFKYIFDAPEVSDSGYLMQTDVRPMTTTRTGDDRLDYTLPSTAFEYLDKMRELCEENGVELILVKAPTNHWKFWWYDEWDEQIADYADKYELDYINFIPLCDEIGIDWSTDTYDEGMHLNVFGAEKLTDYFGKILSEEYGIPDRRGESELSLEWQTRIDKYYERKNSNG